MECGHIYFALLLCLCPVTARTDNTEKAIVNTNVGTFVGYIYRFDAFGNQLSSRRFLKIPYAQPPIGTLRFEKPLRMEKLTQAYDASKYGPACMQQILSLDGERKPGVFEGLSMSEDCLFLNIYTPEATMRNEKLSVVIFFHGGGFVIGSPNMYAGDILASYGNVIYVSVAYRLSVWGFLSTGDENLPGNYGLWDQRMAIQWVHENIASFGGDPDSITLIGVSAGAASVIYQSMFPANQGLFIRGILHSGSITCPWAFNTDPLKATKRFAQLLGCDTQRTTTDISNCLKSKPTDEMNFVLNNDTNQFIRFPMEFIPTVDHDFLPESPKDLFHGASDIAQQYRNAFSKIDLITGVVSNEGLMMITSFVGVQNTEKFETDRNRFEYELVPEVLRVVFGRNVSDVERRLVIHEYTNWEDPDCSFNSRESYIVLSGDYVFNIQMVETASLHSEISEMNTYVYVYDAFPSQHILEAPSWSNRPQHVDDYTTLLGYDSRDGYTQWTTPYTEGRPATWELELSKAHITMWANFAKSGNPNQPTDVHSFIKTTWPKYDKGSQHYLNISRQMSGESVGQRPYARAMNFWYKLLPGLLGSRSSELYNKMKNYCEREAECDP